MNPLRQPRRGYSLIEVIVGTALLAVVALTITGLFVKGRQGVNSGKLMTSSLSTAQHVAEDLDGLSYAMLTSGWNVGGTAISQTASRATIEIYKSGGVWNAAYIAGGNANWGPTQPSSASGNPGVWPQALTGEQAAGSAVLASTITTQPLAAYIARWTAEMDALPQPRLRIMLTPLYDIDDNGTLTANNRATFAAAVIIQIEVAIQWTEGPKERSGGQQRTRYVALTQARTYNEV
jgi:prepilin-type N-terminal cleavage/methylation domain-containing protein